MTIQYNNPVGADYQGLDGIEKVICSHSTGTLHFYRQVKPDRLQPLPLARLISLKPQKIQQPPRLKSDLDRSPICHQPRQQQIPLAIPPV
ncbi:hypothetical protein QT975_21030 [Microcoleus sp. w2-18aC4]|uniref:hypothetical protein n=1 Tax=unclassified Microcoleus TaxID=2642155 RepID=UPI002FD52581